MYIAFAWLQSYFLLFAVVDIFFQLAYLERGRSDILKGISIALLNRGVKIKLHLEINYLNLYSPFVTDDVLEA